MAEEISGEEVDLSDAELIELIKNHGIDRRSLMKVLGVGTVLSLGAGKAAASHDDPHPPHIDSHYGYAAPEDEDLPRKLQPDHTVELLIDEDALFDRDSATIPFYFEPMGLKVEAGDIIRFDSVTPDHTTTAYHLGQGRQQRVPDDKPPFSSPVMSTGGFWLYEFDSPGTYDLLCGPHEPFGMVMRIVVGDPADPNYDDEFGEEGRPPVSRSALTDLGITEWPFPTPEEIFATDALEVTNIADVCSVPHSAVADDL